MLFKQWKWSFALVATVERGSPMLALLCYFVNSLWLEVRWSLCLFCFSISLKTNSGETFFFTYLLVVCMSSFEKCLFESLAISWHFPLFSNTLMKIKAPCFQIQWLFTKQELPLRKVMVVNLKWAVLFYFPYNRRPLPVQSHINYMLQSRRIECCTRINFVPT